MLCALFWLLLTGAGPTWGRNVPETTRNKSLSLAILAAARYMQGDVASFSVALEEVERRQLLPGYTIDWKYWDTDCSPFKGMYGSSVLNILDHMNKISANEKIRFNIRFPPQMSLSVRLSIYPK